MNRDLIMRRALKASFFFNLLGALLFAFPDSLGQLAGLPGPASPLHRTFLAFMVVLFGFTYGWLARQERIDRPLVVFSAIGKTGFFVVALLCWIFGALPGRGVLAAFGDFAFAGVFTWWLLDESPVPAAAADPARRVAAS